MSQIHRLMAYDIGGKLVGVVMFPHRDRQAVGDHASWSCELCDVGTDLLKTQPWQDGAELLQEHLESQHPSHV
jgi:hypothetical protein